MEMGGLTWLQLDAAIMGLQQAMFNNQIFREAMFTILDGLTEKKEQGKGMLRLLEQPSANA